MATKMTRSGKCVRIVCGQDKAFNPLTNECINEVKCTDKLCVVGGTNSDGLTSSTGCVEIK
jgi:hypothetical protein